MDQAIETMDFQKSTRAPLWLPWAANRIAAMSKVMDGPACVYCQKAFNTPNGKTAHGLVRFTKRYNVVAVIDRRYAGRDSGEVLDGKVNHIPVVASLKELLSHRKIERPDYFVMGLAPDGGRLSPSVRDDIREAIQFGLNVDSGLHDFITEDPELVSLAEIHKVSLRDVRKPPLKKDLHFFEGKIKQVKSLKVVVLGTDSGVGKRTTAWILVKSLQELGYNAEMIGTGQTSWLQGVRYGITLDSIINDFVAGEIEHVLWTAWKETQADVLVIEGQGSLMNPAYPGGFELLAAGSPDVIILQHAPARKEYDGFPGYPMQPLQKQIQALELISSKPVVAVTLNHEHIPTEEIAEYCQKLSTEQGLPVMDVLQSGGLELARIILAQKKN